MNSAPSFRWLGHSSVLVSGPNSPSVAVDPWRWRLGDVTADLVVITHGHADHCSEDDIALVFGPGTTVLCPTGLAERLGAAFPHRTVALAEGETFEREGLRVAALPHEGPARAVGFHPRGHGLSWLLDVGGARHLFLGDSTALPEHEGLAREPAIYERADARTERRELATAIAAGVAALPDGQRAVLVLREYHDLDYGEIATALELDLGTVKSRLARARSALRSHLAAALPELAKEHER